MVDAILPARIVRERPGTQLVRYRPANAGVVAAATGAGDLRDDMPVLAWQEMPWYGFRIEEKYGALLSVQRYRARKSPLCGIFVDLHV